MLAARSESPQGFTESHRWPLKKLTSKGDEQQIIIIMLLGQLRIIHSDHL